MLAVYSKELKQFFSSLTGYIAITAFLLLNGLFLFVFPETSIFDFGYATLDKFFELAPWILLLLIPAVCMRTFSDEFRSGTFEILRTRPISSFSIVLGKYLATLQVIVIALLPTLIYIISIRQLSSDQGIDTGGIAGSYIGLLLLAAVFASIGVCCSSFTSNPIVAFITAAFFCFFLYNGFKAVSLIPAFAGVLDYYVEMLGIDFHYHNISRGVIDARDLLYFLTIICICLGLTQRNLSKK